MIPEVHFWKQQGISDFHLWCNILVQMIFTKPENPPNIVILCLFTYYTIVKSYTLSDPFYNIVLRVPPTYPLGQQVATSRVVQLMPAAATLPVASGSAAADPR